MVNFIQQTIFFYDLDSLNDLTNMADVAVVTASYTEGSSVADKPPVYEELAEARDESVPPSYTQLSLQQWKNVIFSLNQSLLQRIFFGRYFF